MKSQLFRVLSAAGIGFAAFSLSACQSSTETYRGDERSVSTPSKHEVKQSMAATTNRADPEMMAVLEAMQSLNPKPIQSLSAETARSQPTMTDAVMKVMERQGQSKAPQEVGKIDNLSIPGPAGSIPVRLYVPKGNGPFPIIVYYHGGGWVIATIDTYDASARALTNAAHAIVMSVEYRKAPEYRFPAAHEDAYAAYEWARAHGRDINGDPERIAVAGESADGNLAGAVSIMARQRGVPVPIHQTLIYPVTGYDMDTTSYRKNAQAQPLNKAMMGWFFEKYFNSPADANNPMFNLVGADDLTGLPPASIITAEIDPLQSEGKRYADRLRAAGVPVMYRNFDGVTHEFFGMGAVVPDAKQAVQFVGSDLHRSFDQANGRRAQN